MARKSFNPFNQSRRRIGHNNVVVTSPPFLVVHLQCFVKVIPFWNQVPFEEEEEELFYVQGNLNFCYCELELGIAQQPCVLI